MATERPVPEPAKGTFAYRIVPAVAVLLWLAIAYVAWNNDLYYVLANHLGVPALQPMFIDTYTPLSWLDCTRKGFDVTISNPCDIMSGTPMDYGPLWLVFAGTGLSPFDTTWLGAALAGCFVITMIAWIRPASWGQAFYHAALLVAPATLLALERGNIDIPVFLLFLVVAALLSGPGLARAVGYGVIFALGTIKFYPLVALGIAIRERTAILLATVAAVVVGLWVYVAAYWDQLATVFGQLQRATYPLSISSTDVVDLVAFVSGLSGAPISIDGFDYTVVRAVLLIVAAGVAFLVARRFDKRGIGPIGSCYAMTAFFLGASLFAGCFFLTTNFAYRGIFLFLCVPALFATLSRGAADVPSQRFAWWVLALIMGTLWVNLIFANLLNAVEVMPKPLFLTGFIGFAVIAELMKWALAVCLFATIWRVVAVSPVSLALRSAISALRRTSTPSYGADVSRP